MPELFAPEWEYYAPNPEIQYLFDLSAARVGRAHALEFDHDAAQDGRSTGLQFSTRPNARTYWAADVRIPDRPERPRVTCETCGFPFVPHSGGAGRFCSRDCAGVGARVLLPRACARPECGRLFRPCVGRRRYCSRKCAAAVIGLSLRRRVVRPCAFCGVDVEHPASRPRRFCGVRCWRADLERVRLAKPAPPPRPVRGAVLAACGTCGAQFERLWRTHRYCSNACAPRVGRAKRPRRPCVCGVRFRPKSAHQWFCSRTCAGLSGGRPKGSGLTILPRHCPTCGDGFRPDDSRRVFCGLRCAGIAANRDRKVNATRLARFAALYTAGAKMVAIAAELVVSLVQLKRYRRRLDLPARPAGNQTRTSAAKVCELPECGRVLKDQRARARYCCKIHSTLHRRQKRERAAVSNL